MTSPGQVQIAVPSLMSLFLQMRANGAPLATGTGFMVSRASGPPVLLTAWHNFSGIHPETGALLAPNGAVPDEVVVWHNLQTLGGWKGVAHPILDAEGQPLWFVHPQMAQQKIDIAALPVTLPGDGKPYPYNLAAEPQLAWGPADSVSVVGFPFGRASAGRFAIWMTGFIASDPDVDFQRAPMFLIDCRSRPGQSGSAVIAYRGSGAIATRDGATMLCDGPVWDLLGLYSGRIDERADLGMVWKTSALREVVAQVPT